MAEMYLPHRISERLSEVLDEIEEEIIEETQKQVEEDDAEAGPCSYEEARGYVEHDRARVTQLMDGKTGWLDGTDDPWPSWSLDHRREVAEIVLCRRWINGLDRMLARLIDVDTLVLKIQVRH